MQYSSGASPVDGGVAGGQPYVILSTPTGSGKSLAAFALHFASLARGRRSVYTCPIKALVN